MTSHGGTPEIYHRPAEDRGRPSRRSVLGETRFLPGGSRMAGTHLTFHIFILHGGVAAVG